MSAFRKPGDWLKNPIVFTLVLIGLPLFLFAAGGGMALTETMQLLVAPYSYDFSRGVGKVVDGYASAVLLGMQVVLVTMIFVVPRVHITILRYVLWGVGVALVVMYFGVMLVLYVSTGIH